MLIKGSQLSEEKTAHGAFKKVLTRNGDVPHIPQVALGEFKEAYSTEQHAHTHETMWELYYILEGKARYTVGDEINIVEPGDFIAVPPKTRHFQESLEAPHRFLYWGVAIDEKI
jgi:mannose-6-phosphate isomerase-like protein (cupin superfamily)